MACPGGNTARVEKAMQHRQLAKHLVDHWFTTLLDWHLTKHKRQLLSLYVYMYSLKEP